jgi:hypothetical protein
MIRGRQLRKKVDIWREIVGRKSWKATHTDRKGARRSSRCVPEEGVIDVIRITGCLACPKGGQKRYIVVALYFDSMSNKHVLDRCRDTLLGEAVVDILDGYTAMASEGATAKPHSMTTFASTTQDELENASTLDGETC